MTPPSRILLLMPNRYRALLFQKAMTRLLPEALVARFISAASAVEELLRSVYQAAVLDLDTLSSVEAKRIFAALNRSRTPGVVALKSAETPESKKRTVSQRPGTVLVDVDEAPDRIAAAVAATLKMPAPAASFGPKTNSPHLSHLVAAGQ